MATRLSLPQVAMLRRIAQWRGMCPGPAGAKTAMSLVKRGLATKRGGPGGSYYITEAGSAALQEIDNHAT